MPSAADSALDWLCAWATVSVESHLELEVEVGPELEVGAGPTSASHTSAASPLTPLISASTASGTPRGVSDSVVVAAAAGWVRCGGGDGISGVSTAAPVDPFFAGVDPPAMLAGGRLEEKVKGEGEQEEGRCAGGRPKT